ncbi:jg3473 [Pararge aegeria aegeria]|uniref:Jg3473 protein n=1 Tax=Pararge aegeria aegeria TaxID=348720 RepID=A0A8S4R689_9NEOP|nr:jg3473 [Pararge aegeria aegeria]
MDVNINIVRRLFTNINAGSRYQNGRTRALKLNLVAGSPSYTLFHSFGRDVSCSRVLRKAPFLKAVSTCGLVRSTCARARPSHEIRDRTPQSPPRVRRDVSCLVR